MILFRLNAIGVDAAFAHMGIAFVEIMVSDAGQVGIRCKGLQLVDTEVTENRKVVRKSSTELRRAKELHDALVAACVDKTRPSLDAQFAFVEVPSGSQSANAARALGIAVGVLAGCPAPIIEVSPREVKEAVLGGRSKGTMPTKAEIIRWAMERWPDAGWRLHKRAIAPRRIPKGVNKGKMTAGTKAGTPLAENEHLADALVAVAAGVATPDFQRVLALMMRREVEPAQPNHRRRIEL